MASASNQTIPSQIEQQVKMKEIVDSLNKKRAEQRATTQKLSELESDASEHKLVIDVLHGVSSDRTCYRMIDGVLVQQTVKDVLPSVEGNFEMLKKTITTYQEKLKEQGTDISEFVRKHNLAPLIRSRNGQPSTESSVEPPKSDDKTKSSLSVLVE